MQYGPAVRRRKLGAELRTLRAEAGLTSGEAARLVGWHQSKVSRIETGASGVKPPDVRLLLDAYQVGDPQLRDMLPAPTTAAAGTTGGTPIAVYCRPPTGTSSAWSHRPARSAPWRPRWFPACCRRPSTPGR
jgi:DNA-binding XRE family transcriptional regulator